jgi:predicted DNA-binding transcriptional regulator AlpA
MGLTAPSSTIEHITVQVCLYAIQALGGREIKMQNAVLDTPKAAAYVGLSKPTLERKRISGDGPSFVKMGHAVRYRITDLDAWLAARVVTSTSQKVAA